MKVFSTEEQNQHYNNRPSMPVDAVAILQDSSDRILIVKPSYKSGWALPGGCWEGDETPLASLLREVKEEIDIDLAPKQLKLVAVRYVGERNGRKPYTQLFFQSKLTKDQVKNIKLQEDELSDYRFVTRADLAEYADAPRMQSVIAFFGKQSSGAGAYLENEKVVC